MRTWMVALAALALIGAGVLVLSLRGGRGPGPASGGTAGPATGGDGGRVLVDAVAPRDQSWPLGAPPAPGSADSAAASIAEVAEAAAGAPGEAADPGGGDDDQPPEHLRDEVEALRRATEQQAMLRMMEVTLAEQAERYVADVNDDGKLDVMDLAEFLRWMDAGDTRADFSGDGMLNHMDSVAFQSDLAAQRREAAPDQGERLAVLRAMAAQHETVVFELHSELRQQIELMVLHPAEPERER